MLLEADSQKLGEISWEQKEPQAMGREASLSALEHHFFHDFASKMSQYIYEPGRFSVF